MYVIKIKRYEIIKVLSDFSYCIKFQVFKIGEYIIPNDVISSDTHNGTKSAYAIIPFIFFGGETCFFENEK